MIVQRDLKRLLAYSSIEHMGIVAIGVGLGGALGLYGALLHAFNHSIAKTLLFFTAGNVREHFGTLRMERIRGMARALPWTSSGLVVGSLAIVGMPPFGLFVSEFIILTAAFSQAKYAVAVVVLVGLSVVFGALLHHFQAHALRRSDRSHREAEGAGFRLRPHGNLRRGAAGAWRAYSDSVREPAAQGDGGAAIMSMLSARQTIGNTGADALELLTPAQGAAGFDFRKHGRQRRSRGFTTSLTWTMNIACSARR